MDKYAHPQISHLFRDLRNKYCFDCGVPSPKWASVNNGVFLCLNCAGVHRSFGVNISFVRSLTIDNWEDKHIKLLMAGGNAKFKSFLEEYSIPLNTDPLLKYKLVAVEYYRKKLRSDAFGDELPEKPDSVSGLATIEDGIKKETEINNMNFISNETFNLEPPKKNNGFFSKVGTFFEKTAGEIGGKIKEMNIGEKAKIIGKTTSQFVNEKSKDVINSQLVKSIVGQTKNLFVGTTKSKESRDYPCNFPSENNAPSLDIVSEPAQAQQQEEEEQQEQEHEQGNQTSSMGSEEQDINNFFVSNSNNGSREKINPYSMYKNNHEQQNGGSQPIDIFYQDLNSLVQQNGKTKNSSFSSSSTFDQLSQIDFTKK